MIELQSAQSMRISLESMKEAARIGINACIDKLGRDFVLANRDNGTSAYGESNGTVFCFVGVNNKPWVPEVPDALVLDNTSQFPYRASCKVRLTDGAMTFNECILPN